MDHEKIVIIGSGPAGWTAAIYTARAELAPLVIAGEMPGGLLTQTSEIENFPGTAKGATGFELMMNMQQQAESFGARIEYDAVTRVTVGADGKVELELSAGRRLGCDALIVATGSSPRYLGLPAEERLRNRGVSACATCDGAFFKDQVVVVAGGGDSAAEESTFLTRFAAKVYLIHRRHELRASKIMADRVLANSKIEVLWDTVVTDILGENEVEGVKLRNKVTGEQRTLDCKGYFAALGHIPNTALFKGLLEMDESGYIRRRGTSCRTNIKNIFAAGDCTDHVYRQAISAAGMGCKAAIDAERYLAGHSHTP